MNTVLDLAKFLTFEHLWLRMGHDSGVGWWASLRNDRRLTFEGRGKTPEEALVAARQSYERWRSGPPTLS